jgi:hypothetical protein
MPGQQEKCFLCGQAGHLAAECRGPSQANSVVEQPPIHKKKYQVLQTMLLVDHMYSCLFNLSSFYVYISYVNCNSSFLAADPSCNYYHVNSFLTSGCCVNTWQRIWKLLTLPSR